MNVTHSREWNSRGLTNAGSLARDSKHLTIFKSFIIIYVEVRGQLCGSFSLSTFTGDQAQVVRLVQQQLLSVSLARLLLLPLFIFIF